MPDDFCHQCFGRGWVTINHKKVRCTCRLLKKPDIEDAKERGPIPEIENHGRGYGGKGQVSTVLVDGKPAAISQACGDYIVAMTKGVLGLLLVLLLVACSHKPDFYSGRVVGSGHDSASTTFVNVCVSYGKYGCTAYSLIPVHHPESWSLTVENCDYKDKKDRCKRESFDVPEQTWATARTNDWFDAKSGELS